jgi:putative endonuclease
MEWRATADAVRFTSDQWYVYILKLSNNTYYVGCTSDIKNRLIRHMNGYVDATKYHLPLEIVFYSTFFDKYKAFQFEKYLKSGSGRAFAKKHLI